MELNYRTLTDQEMQTVLHRARVERAVAIRKMGQAFGAWAKSRIQSMTRITSGPVEKTA